MFEVTTLLYLFFVLSFIGGVFVIIYHLLTFRLNKSLAWFMTILLVIGAIILLSVNIFYFSEINWRIFFSSSNLL